MEYTREQVRLVEGEAKKLGQTDPETERISNERHRTIV